MNSDSHKPQKPSLETLLQLKRAEKPSPEFWNQFEKDLEKSLFREAVQSSPSKVSSHRGLMVRATGLLAASAACGLVVVFWWDRSLPLTAVAHTTRESFQPMESRKTVSFSLNREETEAVQPVKAHTHFVVGTLDSEAAGSEDSLIPASFTMPVTSRGNIIFNTPVFNENSGGDLFY